MATATPGGCEHDLRRDPFATLPPMSFGAGVVDRVVCAKNCGYMEIRSHAEYLPTAPSSWPKA